MVSGRSVDRWIDTHVRNAVTLVWDSLRLSPITTCIYMCTSRVPPTWRHLLRDLLPLSLLNKVSSCSLLHNTCMVHPKVTMFYKFLCSNRSTLWPYVHVHIQIYSNYDFKPCKACYCTSLETMQWISLTHMVPKVSLSFKINTLCLIVFNTWVGCSCFVSRAFQWEPS